MYDILVSLTLTRHLEVSKRPIIANLMFFINKSKFSKWEFTNIKIFRLTRWDT